jgi:hypothetical protein
VIICQPPQILAGQGFQALHCCRGISIAKSQQTKIFNMKKFKSLLCASLLAASLTGTMPAMAQTTDNTTTMATEDTDRDKDGFPWGLLGLLGLIGLYGLKKNDDRHHTTTTTNRNH